MVGECRLGDGKIVWYTTTVVITVTPLGLQRNRAF